MAVEYRIGLVDQDWPASEYDKRDDQAKAFSSLAEKLSIEVAQLMVTSGRIKVRTFNTVKFASSGEESFIDTSSHKATSLNLETNKILVTAAGNVDSGKARFLDQDSLDYYSNLHTIAYVKNVGWVAPSRLKNEKHVYTPISEGGLIEALKFKGLSLNTQNNEFKVVA